MFGEVIAVNRVDLKVERGEFVTLLGPSGCGKTTTLRMVAGLEQNTTGRISIGDARRQRRRRPASSCRRIIASSAWCSSPTRSGRT